MQWRGRRVQNRFFISNSKNEDTETLRYVLAILWGLSA